MAKIRADERLLSSPLKSMCRSRSYLNAHGDSLFSIILLDTHLLMRLTEREHSFLDSRGKVCEPMDLLSLKEFKELCCGFLKMFRLFGA